MYCDLDDIKKRLSEKNILELTDSDDMGEIDTEKSDAAIADADSEIDGYLSIRFSTPLSPVPALLKKLSVDISIYNLYSLSDFEAIPELREKRYNDAIKLLKSIAEGEAGLDIEDTDAFATGTVVTSHFDSETPEE